jgi:hypothetical protein
VLTEVSDDSTPALGGHLDLNTYSIITSASGNINLEPSGTGEVVSTKAISRQGFFQAHNTSAHQVSTASGEVEIPLDTATRVDADYFSHDGTTTPEQITITASGDYRITFVVGLDSDYNARVAMRAWLTGNNTELTPSASWCYLRQSSSGGQLSSITSTSIHNIVAPTVIRLHVDSFNDRSTQVNRDVDVIPDETWILIEKI